MLNSIDLTVLRDELTAIRDERSTNANSAERIGNALLALLQVADRDIDPSKYLRRDSDDTASGLIRFIQGIAIGSDDGESYGITHDAVATLRKLIADTLVAFSFNSPSFKSGATGTGFRLGNYGNTEDSYLEVDRLLVRKAAEFVKLVIRELQSVGGEIVLSPAAMKVASVERLTKGVVIPGYERGVPYDIDRCYFLQKDNNGNAVENQFVVNDLVRCQTFNVKTGTSENVRNRYYWRQVYKVGNDFIDVLVDRCDTNSDTPLAGDEIVQFGNTTDKTRQSVILLSAYGDDAPSLKMYYGINSYTFDNKEVFVLSRTEMMALADKFVFKTSTGEKQTFAQLLITMNGLQSTVKSQGAQIGELDSKITQTAESIVSTVSKTYATKSDLSTLQKEVDENGNDITSARSEIKQTADSLSLMVENQNALRNHIKGTAFRSWDSYTLTNTNYPVTFSNGGPNDSRYAIISVSGATENTAAGIRLRGTIMLPGTYIVSIWVNVKTLTDVGCYMRLYSAIGSSMKTIYTTEYFDADGVQGEWQLLKWTITLKTGILGPVVDIVVRKNGVIWVSRPMIQSGDTYLGWSLSPYDVTETGDLESASKKAGIDLRSGKVTVTADNFLVQNNDGDTTASVNAKGVLEVKNGLFSGFVRKQMTTLTPDNISKYIKSSQSNGYLSLDFVAAGSYVNFSGAIAKKLGIGSNYISPILPFYDPSSAAKALGTTLQEAITYIGQTVVIINQSDTTVNIVGGGTIKGGSSTQTYWVGVGYMAVLTCEMVYVSATSYKVVWNGYNIKIA